ncbi:Lar family restriction alleviation protein [Halopseudomonas bauzanensis]|uniref:Lar family restriction alleviation protein n=1 Tax=Halopseudomonas bauzanensis TaxID=653930 RepID=UPI00352530CB
MADQLLPCPFCGQSDFLVERLDYSSSVVICQGMIDQHSACLARGPVGGQDDDGEDQPGYSAAVREWNRRAAAPAPEQKVERKPSARLKEVVTSFFYWWHNQPGNNAAEGYDEWITNPSVQRMVARLLPEDQQAEQEPVGHDWDDQDKCRRCGDRDWYAGPVCIPSKTPTPPAAPDVSGLVEALGDLLDLATSKPMSLERQADAITRARSYLSAHQEQRS